MRVYFLGLVLVVALLGGCPVPQEPPPAVAPPPTVEAPPPAAPPPPQEELAAGRTFQDIYKPVVLSCAEWATSIKVAQGACARELWVELCGEKDEAGKPTGKPTGKYFGNDCPACETLLGIEKQAAAQGCPT